MSNPTKKDLLARCREKGIETNETMTARELQRLLYMDEFKGSNKAALAKVLEERGVSASSSEKKDELLYKLAESLLEETWEAPEKKPKKKKGDAKVAKIKETRRKNTEAIKRSLDFIAGSDEATRRAFGSDADLKPRTVKNAPASLSIDGSGARRLTPEEQTDIDLLESYNNPAVILTGRIVMAIENNPRYQTMVNPATGEEMRCYRIAAVVKYKSRFVYIPAEYFLENYFNMDQDKIGSYIEERGGAEVDFRVTEVERTNPDKPVFIGSRIAAMRKRRCDFWYSDREQGRKLLEAGSIHEARVAAVSKGQLFVELFGAEIRINARDITYNRIKNLTTKYSPGSTEFVMIKSVALADPVRAENLGYPVECELSVRDAKPDPRDKYFEMDIDQGRFNGIVRDIEIDEEENIVYYWVEMGASGFEGPDDEEGVPIRCRLGSKVAVRPQIDDQASGKITYVNNKQKRVFGTIYHIDPPLRKAWR